jgi:type IV pilus assembly protein PilB
VSKPGAKKARLGEALVAQGVITQEQLDRALNEQKDSGQLLGEMLVEQNVIGAATLVHTLAKTMGVRGVLLRHGLIDPAVIGILGEEEAERMLVVPMFKVHDTLTVAMAEPHALPTIDRIRTLTGCKRVRPVLALESNIREFLKKYQGGNVDLDAFLTSLKEQDVEVVEQESVDEGPVTDLEKMVAGSPIINLVNVALLTAVRDKASDIHIEPDRKGTRIRYRIDGVVPAPVNPPRSVPGGGG